MMFIYRQDAYDIFQIPSKWNTYALKPDPFRIPAD